MMQNSTDFIATNSFIFWTQEMAEIIAQGSCVLQ